MKKLLIAILTLSATIAFAQQTVTWKGGTPGKETSWNEAKNWSNNKVPNTFSDVIIEDVSTSTFSTPKIKDGIIELNSIHIASNTKLSIEADAKVIVYSYAEGLFKENIDIKGTLMVMGEFEGDELKNVVIHDNN
jgi:hypothetical protein